MLSLLHITEFKKKKGKKEAPWDERREMWRALLSVIYSSEERQEAAEYFDLSGVDF